MLRHPRMIGRALEGDVERQLEPALVTGGGELVHVVERAEIGVRRRGGRRCPTGCRRRRARPRRCCCGPCGGRRRSDGSAGGRARRSPGRRRSRGDRSRRQGSRVRSAGRSTVERGKNSYQALNRPRSGSMSTGSGPDVASGLAVGVQPEQLRPARTRRASRCDLRRSRRRALEPGDVVLRLRAWRRRRARAGGRRSACPRAARR